MADGAGVLAHEHHDGAEHDLLAVHRGRAAAESGSPLHFGDVFDLHRLHGGTEFDRQLRNLLRGAHAADAADGELLAIAVDDAAAGVFDVAADDVGELADGHVGGLELVEHRLDGDLALMAAVAVDLGHALHGAQHGFDDVLVRFPQAHEAFAFIGGFLLRVFFPMQRVVEDFAEAGADRREAELAAGRQVLHDGGEPLGDELTCAEDVRAVLKLDGDLAEAEFGDGTRVEHAGHAAERHFDGPRDGAFRFLGREGRNSDVHLHLRAGEIRHGVDGQMHERVKPATEKAEGPEQHECALPDGEFEKEIEHKMRKARSGRQRKKACD